MKETITFVGLDSHKDRISVTLAETTGEREVRYLGEIDNTAEAVDALVEKLGETHDALAFCYEAGPCGGACPCEGGGHPSPDHRARS